MTNIFSITNFFSIKLFSILQHVKLNNSYYHEKSNPNSVLTCVFNNLLFL